MKRSRIYIVLSFLFMSAFLIKAHATGYSDPVTIGARAIGMGGAFVGIADDSTAVYHNPAAVSLLKGHKLNFGLDTYFVNSEFTPPGGTTEKSKKDMLPTPFLFYTKDLTEELSFGLGVYFPHGIGVRFSSPSANPLNPNEVDLNSMEITPVLSAKVPEIEGLSLGAGLRIVRISSEIKGQGIVLSQTPLFIDTLDELDVSGWTYGAVFSALYKPVNWLQLGTVYRTRLKTNLTGDGSFATLGAFSASVSQVIPALFSGGIGLFPTEKLKIGISYDFEQNSQNNQISVNSAAFPGGLVLPINWRDTHTIHFGISYDWTDWLYTSAGYARDLNNAIPDGSSDRSNADFDSHNVAAGLGVKLGKFDVSGAAKIFFGDNDVANTPANPIPGKFSTFLITSSLNVGYTF